ncbi:MAG: phage tail protein [Oscillospiraceae bacterium]|nr:phage tail protein [Oscillospiraceae bacterium]
MLKVFGRTDRDFSSNGDVVLRAAKAKLRKEDNGDFYLDVEAPVEYADVLTEGRIIVANTPQGDEPFRIANPQKTRRKVSFRAWHVFYDSENYVIADSYVVNMDCAAALEHLNAATDATSPFTVASDVPVVNSFRCVRKSLCEAVAEVVARWGGHIVRKGFTIAVTAEIGRDNGETVRYGKNLREITCEENWNDVVTKLLPVGRDGLLLNELDPDADIYLYSPVQYPTPYTKVVPFDQDIDEDDFRGEDGEVDQLAYTQALVDDLRNQGEAYISANNVPKVYYTLNAALDRVSDVGDTIEVIDYRLGVDIMTHVIAFEYDCILKRYTLIEFGNMQQKLENLLPGINKDIEKVKEQVEAVSAIQTAIVQAGPGWSGSFALTRQGAIVALSGTVSPTASISLGETPAVVGVVPAAFRPASAVSAILQGDGARIFNLDVLPGGNVQISRFRSGTTYDTATPGMEFPIYGLWVK